MNPWGFTSSVRLQYYDARLPSLILMPVNLGGGGVSEWHPTVNEANDIGYVCNGYTVEALLTDTDDPAGSPVERGTPPGTLFPGPDATGDWAQSDLCPVNNLDMPLLRMISNEFYNLFSCDYGPDVAVIIEQSPVIYYPIRVDRGVDGTIYGWVAVQGIDAFNPDCDEFGCQGEPLHCSIAMLRFVGAGFETEIDTPIIVGGGLCEADVNLDAVLDLADVQAFVGAFIDQQPPADLNGDGVYDLADVQAFIDAFLSGCAL